MNLKHTLTALALGALTFSSFDLSAQQENYFRAIGTPHKPKVEIAWNRYYSSEGLWDWMKKIAQAHPHLAKIESIGKSVEGRDILTLTITDFSTGKDTEKPAMWIDGISTPIKFKEENFPCMQLGT